MERWIFEVEQNGMIVAEGDAPDRDAALREAAHYVAIYSQDGPATAMVREAVIKYDDADEQALYDRVVKMTEEERCALDPLAKALGEYLRRERPPIMALPNRVVALACVDLARQWNRFMLERE